MADRALWDAIEDKERQFASRQKAQRDRNPPTGKALAVPAGALADNVRKFITPVELQALERRSYPQPVISFYLSLTPDKLVPEKKEYLAAWHSLKHRALEDNAELLSSVTREQRQGVETDLEEIETFLTNDFNPDGVKSLMILKSGNDLRTVVTLPIYLRDVLVIDPNPYVLPLEETFEAYKPVLIVRIRRGEALFSLYRLGWWEELPSVRELVSKARTDAGKPGKAQRLYEAQLKLFLKEVVTQIERLFASGRFAKLIIVGEENTTVGLKEMFSDKLAATGVVFTGEDPRETRTDLETRAEKVLTETKLQQEVDAYNRVEELADKERLITGLAGVCDALNRSVVRELLLSENLIAPGFVCRRHQYLALSEGECPFCHRPLWPVRNLVDSVVEAAARQKVTITVFRQNPTMLDNYFQIAAVTYPVDAVSS